MSARLPSDASIPSRFPPGFRGERAPRTTAPDYDTIDRLCKNLQRIERRERWRGRLEPRRRRAPPIARRRTASVAELVGGVERGDLVAFGECRVVEDRLQEV